MKTKQKPSTRKVAAIDSRSSGIVLVIGVVAVVVLAVITAAVMFVARSKNLAPSTTRATPHSRTASILSAAGRSIQTVHGV
jgi:flagellar basal body-associated protein FliL